MFGYRLKASLSHPAVARALRGAERAAALAPGAVLHGDGTPVLTCDLKILAPYRIEPGGVYRLLVPV